MIPHKLQIKNFLSYGPELQTIDFSPYHLICLSGKNGHGKSALLDAITWAIWGQARKTPGSAKPDQGLLHLGQTQMMVILDFSLGDNLYRVRREYAQTYGKPYANLEFGMIDPDTNTIIPLTDKTIRLTQAKIEQTLRLDFELFTNSVFLRQGNANEFSKKSPRDRKEIVATILGLNQYDTIRTLAMDKAKHAASEKQTLHAFQEKINHELEKKEAINQQYATVEEKLKTLTKQEKTLEKNHKTLEKKQRELAEKQKKRELILFEIKKNDEHETAQQQSLVQVVSTWRTVHKKQLKFPDHTTLEQNKKKLIETINQHQQKLQQRLEIKEAYLHTKDTLQQYEKKHQDQHALTVQKTTIERERLLIEQQNTQNNLQTITQQSDQCAKDIKKLGPLDEQAIKKLASSEEQFEKRKAYYQQFIAHGNWLKSERDSLTQRGKLVHDDDPSCPLCEQNLTQARRKFLKNKFAKNNRLLHHQLNRITRVITTLKQVLIEQHKEIQTHKKTVEQRHELNNKIKEINQQQEPAHKVLKQLAKQIDALDAQLKKLNEQAQQQLQRDTEYQRHLQKLQQLEQDAKKNTYNAQEHRQAQEQLAQLEQQLAQVAQLRQEIAQQEQRKEEISKLATELKQIKQQKNKLQKRCAAYENITDEEKTIVEYKNDLIAARKALHKDKDTLLQEKGSLKKEQDTLHKLERERKEHEKKLCTLAQTMDDYQTIATATGKDGIQALLIEQAIPEIEQDANDLLAKLTNNQSHIIIESLRDLKKGGTKETLDINISDPSGIRPYELFSGGEAFRIDFALRIAISKLLARRAGTALQTLIIDEGFGSQDEEGLQHIMDAIYKIQDDFAKVIIVSHLTAMKDQFPVHFMVEKGPQGSHVEILEQG